MLDKIVPGQTQEAQFVKGIWSIWLKSKRAECYLAETIRDVDIDGAKVTLHDIYPSTKPIPNENIVLKDLPQDVNNNAIPEFLKDQPGIHVKSGVIFSRIRDGDSILTPFCTGDRYVYVRGTSRTPCIPQP